MSIIVSYIIVSLIYYYSILYIIPIIYYYSVVSLITISINIHCVMIPPSILKASCCCSAVAASASAASDDKLAAPEVPGENPREIHGKSLLRVKQISIYGKAMESLKSSWRLPTQNPSESNLTRLKPQNCIPLSH